MSRRMNWDKARHDRRAAKDRSSFAANHISMPPLQAWQKTFDQRRNRYIEILQRGMNERRKAHPDKALLARLRQAYTTEKQRLEVAARMLRYYKQLAKTPLSSDSELG